MTKKEIITIAGVPGSGKSSTADGVAKALGYTRFSSGDFFRQVGMEMGLSVNEVNLRAETDPTIDQRTDQKLRDMRDKEKIVIDSRIAFHWIPESFKVFLDLPLEISKERILSNLKHNKLRQDSEGMADAEGVYKKITERLESEKKRYRELYDIDHTDKTNFDLVVDTNQNNLTQVVELVVAKYKEWLEN